MYLENALPQVLHDGIEAVLVDVLLESTSVSTQKCH